MPPPPPNETVLSDEVSGITLWCSSGVLPLISDSFPGSGPSIVGAGIKLIGIGQIEFSFPWQLGSSASC